MTRLRAAWSVLLLLAIWSSAAFGQEAMFCEVGHGFGPDAIYFDLKARHFHAADTSGSIAVETGDFVGFIAPLPFMVPARGIPSDLSEVRWSAENYEFVASPFLSDDDWIAVSATHVGPDGNGLLSKVSFLYSYRSGVLSFKTEWRGMTGEGYLCGPVPLRLTELAAAP